MLHYCGHEWLDNFLQTLDVSNMTALDVGCGIGGTTRFLANKHFRQVYGLDYLQDHVNFANRITTICGL